MRAGEGAIDGKNYADIWNRWVRDNAVKGIGGLVRDAKENGLRSALEDRFGVDAFAKMWRTADTNEKATRLIGQYAVPAIGIGGASALLIASVVLTGGIGAVLLAIAAALASGGTSIGLGTWAVANAIWLESRREVQRQQRHEKHRKQMYSQLPGHQGELTAWANARRQNTVHRSYVGAPLKLVSAF